ncbi:MAG: hypothetical protein LBB91_09825 [Clostridiales bacterium]|jgi:hypothetical protein|nr:hypothetical protein [Clostridiales bacterium]
MVAYNQLKIKWRGIVVSIQPRTRVWRYVTDNRTHYHIGYNLFLDGSANGSDGRFVVAISEIQQQKGDFRIGDEVQGTAWTKQYPEREFADYYRAGSLKRIKKAPDTAEANPPPWKIPLPDMQTYEARGARMLGQSLWKTKCFQCAWASMSNVEIIWDFDKRISKYRFESFCYGPKSCKYYKMGRARAVPYKGRGSSMDTGWLDDLCTEGRDFDE